MVPLSSTAIGSSTRCSPFRFLRHETSTNLSVLQALWMVSLELLLLHWSKSQTSPSHPTPTSSKFPHRWFSISFWNMGRGSTYYIRTSVKIEAEIAQYFHIQLWEWFNSHMLLLKQMHTKYMCHQKSQSQSLNKKNTSPKVRVFAFSVAPLMGEARWSLLKSCVVLLAHKYMVWS